MLSVLTLKVQRNLIHHIEGITSQKVKFRLPEKFEKKSSNFVIGTVPEDGLAQLGTRALAGSVITKF